MNKIIVLFIVVLFTGCAAKINTFEKFYINDLIIKESESDWNSNFSQNETPFFTITDKNSTIAGVFTFKENKINGFVFISNKKDQFNSKKDIFDCDTNLSIIEPSLIDKSGELETELKAVLLKRCFYIK